MSLPYLHPYLGLSNGLNTLHAAGGGGGAVGGWKELGRTTLGGTSDNITVSSLADKRYYMVLGYSINSSTPQQTLRFNGDTGTNYARRWSQDGAADATGTSSNRISTGAVSANGSNGLTVGYISNLSSKEKLVISHGGDTYTAGATTAPERYESVGKWANTSNAINSITVHNPTVGDFDTGSEVVVLGWDPADDDTNGFWQELASADLSGGASDTLSSGTFTAKKYLWVQAWVKATGGTIRGNIRLGNSTLDTGNNYSRRQSTNGSTDSTGTSESFTGANNNMSVNAFINFFVINNTSNEKLVVGHIVFTNTAGAGAAPNREEFVGKWANTSNQADILAIYNSGGTGDFATSSFIKVWGAD